MTNRIGWLYVCIIALSASLVFAGGAHPVTERLPMAIVGRGQINGADIPDGTPVVTIGSISPTVQFGEPNFYPQTPTNWEPLPNGTDAVIKDIVAGNTHFFQADSAGDTLIYVVGPAPSGTDAYLPMALTRKGNLFTLEMVHGAMVLPTSAVAAPTRLVYLISLGKLDPSDYQLDVRITQLAGDAQTYPLYACTSHDTGSVAFTVGNGDALRMATKPPAMLKVADLKSEPEKGTGVMYQLPASLPIAGARGSGADYSVKVGKSDGYAWIGAKHAPGEVPTLAPAKPGDPLSALVQGPMLRSGEWMSLREIAWDGNTAKITVEVWRDGSPRDENAPFTPLLLVPLTPPTNVDRPAPVRVEVSFHGLTAPRLGESYVGDIAKEWKSAQASTDSANQLMLHVLAAGRAGGEYYRLRSVTSVDSLR